MACDTPSRSAVTETTFGSLADSAAATLATNEVLDLLKSGRHLDDDAPWEDLRGVGLTQRHLAKLLKPYSVKPKTIRTGSQTLRGYTKESLWDAWNRYLPTPTAAEAQHAQQVTQANNDGTFSVAENPDVALTSATPSQSATPKPTDSAIVTDVSDVADLRGSDGPLF